MSENTTCVACRREARPGSSVRLERRTVEGQPMLLCVNPTECRRHWPEGDRR